MISPHTPPGTQVVCIKVPKFSRLEGQLPWEADNSCPLRLGCIYTVSEIDECCLTGLFYAFLDEIGPDMSFGLTCFRYLGDLPKCLTDLQNAEISPLAAEPADAA